VTQLWYLANIRLPTEKAHGYQIMQMCEAFSEAGAQVKLLHADRHNRPELEGIEDVWAHYGVTRNFEREKIPCVDWYPWLRGMRGGVARVAERFVSWLQLSSYTLALVARLRAAEADVLYSRDSVPLVALCALRPGLRKRLLYEAHEFPATRVGLWLRRWLVRRVAGVAVVTGHMATLYAEKLGVPAERLLVVPDGVRLERFADVGGRGACRAALGLPAEAFVVGYVGQLHTKGMGKGLDTLTEAVARLAGDRDPRPLRLCVVGGPDDMVGTIRAEGAALGLPDEALVTPGQVHPGEVPRWMRAFDVCVMHLPWTTHFAYYASPLKLFEYMASGSAIAASDLPSFAEILTDGENALLTPPGDVAALAGALRRLRDDPALEARLAAQARRDVEQYSWRARAEALLAFAGEHIG